MSRQQSHCAIPEWHSLAPSLRQNHPSKPKQCLSVCRIGGNCNCAVANVRQTIFLRTGHKQGYLLKSQPGWHISGAKLVWRRAMASKWEMPQNDRFDDIGTSGKNNFQSFPPCNRACPYGRCSSLSLIQSCIVMASKYSVSTIGAASPFP